MGKRGARAAASLARGARRTSGRGTRGPPFDCDANRDQRFFALRRLRRLALGCRFLRFAGLRLAADFLAGLRLAAASWLPACAWLPLFRFARLALGRRLLGCALPLGGLALGCALPLGRLALGCRLLGRRTCASPSTCASPACACGCRLLGRRSCASPACASRSTASWPILSCAAMLPPSLSVRVVRALGDWPLRRHPLQAPPLPFAHAAPHAVSFIATERVVEALDANGTLAADPLRLPR